MSPKIVNGSFVAIFDQKDVLNEYAKTKLRLGAPDSPGYNNLPIFYGLSLESPYFLAMRRRIRGILMSGKQFSLDSHLDLVHGIVGRLAVRPSSDPSGVLPLPTVEDDGGEPNEDINGITKDTGRIDFMIGEKICLLF